jgi:hypothetical protein
MRTCWPHFVAGLALADPANDSAATALKTSRSIAMNVRIGRAVVTSEISRGEAGKAWAC